jgi:hypothetical protein
MRGKSGCSKKKTAGNPIGGIPAGKGASPIGLEEGPACPAVGGGKIGNSLISLVDRN